MPMYWLRVARSSAWCLVLLHNVRDFVPVRQFWNAVKAKPVSA